MPTILSACPGVRQHALRERQEHLVVEAGGAVVIERGGLFAAAPGLEHPDLLPGGFVERVAVFLVRGGGVPRAPAQSSSNQKRSGNAPDRHSPGFASTIAGV